MNLRELQNKWPKTIAETAADLNIKKSTFTKYLAGTFEPSIETLIKFANYYNVSIDYLVGRENDRTFIERHYVDNKNLLNITNKLNAKNLNKVITYASNLLEGQE